MVKVLLDAEPEVKAKLLVEENSIIGGWLVDSVLTAMHFMADRPGQFAIMHAESEDQLFEKLKTLVFYPYMAFEVWEIK